MNLFDWLHAKKDYKNIKFFRRDRMEDHERIRLANYILEMWNVEV